MIRDDEDEIYCACESFGSTKRKNRREKELCEQYVIYDRNLSVINNVLMAFLSAPRTNLTHYWPSVEEHA